MYSMFKYVDPYTWAMTLLLTRASRDDCIPLAQLDCSGLTLYTFRWKSWPSSVRQHYHSLILISPWNESWGRFLHLHMLYWFGFPQVIYADCHTHCKWDERVFSFSFFFKNLLGLIVSQTIYNESIEMILGGSTHCQWIIDMNWILTSFYCPQIIWSNESL